MSVFLCGNSHLGALIKGYNALARDNVVKGTEVTMVPFGAGAHETRSFSRTVKGGVALTREEFRRNLQQRAGVDLIVNEHLWGFCMGTSYSRVYRDRFWRRSKPSEISKGREQPISKALLAAMIEADQRYVMKFFANLSQAQIPYFVISCPFPKKGHKQSVDRVGLDVISYVDNLARETFKSWMSDKNVDFIEPPVECIGDDGFLRAEFEQQFTKSGRADTHHANEEYGKLMLHKVLDYIAAR